MCSEMDLLVAVLLSKLGNAISVSSIQTTPGPIIQSAKGCVSVDDLFVGKDPDEIWRVGLPRGLSFGLADFSGLSLHRISRRRPDDSTAVHVFLLVCACWRGIFFTMTGSLRNRNPSMRGKSRSLLSAPSPSHRQEAKREVSPRNKPAKDR